MIIRLFQTPLKNWLLTAEELNDPENWDRFLPSHSHDSARWQFDTLVKNTATAGLKVKTCKPMLKRGLSVFEYDWNADENDILSHAMEVADRMGVELLVGVPETITAA